MNKSFLLGSFFILLSCSIATGALDTTCPRNGQTDSSTSLQANDPNGPNFSEVSGLALSYTQVGPSGDPVLYTVNDGGGGSRLGVYDSGTGERLLTLTINSLPSANDWESLAIGSCGIPNTTQSCIYIADVGDNWAREDGTRSRRGGVPYRLYKVFEPIWTEYSDNDDISESQTDVLDYDYSHPTSPTEFADCEAIFVDHSPGSQGDVYIITKWGGDNAGRYTRVFLVPTTAWSIPEDDFPYAPAAVGDYDSGGDLFHESWTSADMTLDGTLIALGGIDGIYLFSKCPGTSVADALTGGAESCEIWDHDRSDNANQFETLAFKPDSQSILSMSECNDCNPKMFWTELDYDNPAQVISCPAVETAAPTLAPSIQPTLAPSVKPTTATIGGINATTPLPSSSTTSPPTLFDTTFSLPSFSPTLPPSSAPTVSMAPSIQPSTTSTASMIMPTRTSVSLLCATMLLAWL